jgi:hypothetical protein
MAFFDFNHFQKKMKITIKHYLDKKGVKYLYC